jgi:hypothetical protein
VRDLRLEWESGDLETWCRSEQAFAIRMITVFTPSFADHSNTNAQDLAGMGGVTRMDSSRFRVEASLANRMKQDWRSFRNSYAWRA